jgi:hypothetical protein
MLTHLQIGHTCLTHGHLLCGELAPVCINSGVPLIVIECPLYGKAHLAYHLNGTLSTMLR